jgi:hypothetical protein
MHEEELRNLYFSSSIIKILKSRRMRWSGHVEMRNACKVYWKERATRKTKM